MVVARRAIVSGARPAARVVLAAWAPRPRTGVPRKPSAAGIAVVTAAAAVHERPGPVAHRHRDAAPVRQIGGRPVREEHADVLAEGAEERCHAGHRSGLAASLRGATLLPMTARRRRAIGFALGAAGALAAGIGSLLPWTVVGLRADPDGVLDETFRGIDLAGGAVVLAAAMLVLVGLVAIRLVPDPVRLSIALAFILAGLAIVTAPVLAIAAAEDRATAEMARAAAATGGLTPAEAEELVRTNRAFAVRWSVGPGVWLAVAGGVAVIAAGAVVAGERRGRLD